MSINIPRAVAGNLASDPELKTTPNGNTVATFRLAENARRLNRETQEYETTATYFHECEIWGKRAENFMAAGLSKGDAVLASGDMQLRSWQDKETGNHRQGTRLVVSDIGPNTVYQARSDADIDNSVQAEMAAQQSFDNPQAQAAQQSWQNALQHQPTGFQSNSPSMGL